MYDVNSFQEISYNIYHYADVIIIFKLKIISKKKN